MALYDFQCAACGAVFEVERPLGSTGKVKCTSCGSMRTTKMFSAAGIVFKGSGFYVTDSKKSGGSSSIERDSSPSGSNGSSGGDKPPSAGSDSPAGKPAADKPADSGGSTESSGKGKSGKDAGSGSSPRSKG